jgi:hypothetical protein
MTSSDNLHFIRDSIFIVDTFKNLYIIIIDEKEKDIVDGVKKTGDLIMLSVVIFLVYCCKRMLYLSV